MLFRVALSEVENLIFSPVGFQGHMLCDAIDGKNLGRQMDEVLSELSCCGDSQAEVAFIPTMCPNCGADLIGEKESVLLFCANCQQAWKVTGGALQAFSATFIAGSKDARYLPFWCFRPDLEGLAERLFIDPAKTGGPGRGRVYLDDPGFSFWLPAFKVNASIFMTLAERATVARPSLNDATAEIEGDVYPCTIPATEAVKLANVMIALLIGRPEAARPLFERTIARPQQAQLCFIPFSFTGYEFVQEKMRMSILPNALKYGRNL